MTDDLCILFYRVWYCISYGTENKLFYFIFFIFFNVGLRYINVIYVLKKLAKKWIITLKLPWDLSVLIRPKIIVFLPAFYIPASSLVGFSATVESFDSYMGEPRGERRLEKRTDHILFNLIWWNRI